MRDFLSYDPAEFDPALYDQVLSHPDPIKRTQNAMRKDSVRRFYTDVSVEPRSGGYAVLLDGRQIKTPAKRAFILPASAVAERARAEWAAQTDFIVPGHMPVSRLANSILDGVVDAPEPVAAEIVKYAGTDLVCYRADTPDRLVARQSAAWDPVLDWTEDKLGARLLVGEGVIHVAQDPEALAAIARHVAGYDAWALGALQVLTALSGSALLALMVAHRALGWESAWDLAHIDEDWSIEQWGEDTEATTRRTFRKREFEAAAAVLGSSAR